MVMERIVHTIDPVFDQNSRILILGSLPSPASRSFGFYYGHPQNIFWPLLASLLAVPEPRPDIASRREFALSHKIALWDVLASADIVGAADSSIQKPLANDLGPILAAADIRAIFTTGKAAHRYYKQLIEPQTGRPAIYLPSTSPANRAAQKQAGYQQAWQQILLYLPAD